MKRFHPRQKRDAFRTFGITQSIKWLVIYNNQNCTRPGIVTTPNPATDLSRKAVPGIAPINRRHIISDPNDSTNPKNILHLVVPGRKALVASIRSSSPLDVNAVVSGE